MSVHVLVDMNLTPNWVGYFATHGIDATHWSTLGDPAAPDTELMEWARSNHAAIFTYDLDFGTALALTGAAGPSVIQLRGRDVLPSQSGTTVVKVLQKYSAEIEAGALVVIDETRLRVRILPLRD
jgi:predicted nuclease of predicted toxin-antitoxin system